MSTLSLFQYKLLERFKNDIVFVEFKADKIWNIGDFTWPDNVSFPVVYEEIAKQVRQNQVDQIPIVAIIKGLVTALGLEDSDFPYNEVYRDALLSIDPSIVESIMADAIKYANKQLYLEAILYFNAARLIDPKGHLPLFYLGRCYYDLAITEDKNSFYKAAEHYFEQVNSLTGGFSEAYYFLGFCYYNSGSYIEAEKSWLSALETELPEDTKQEIVDSISKVRDRADFERGVGLILSERFEEGLEVLKTLEEYHDDWWELIFYIGLGLRFQELYEEALPYFLKTLSLNTGYLQAMNEAGICALNIGDYTLAHYYYDEALRLSPDHSELLCNKGIVYYYQGQTSRALQCLNAAKALDPEDVIINQWLATIENQTYN